MWSLALQLLLKFWKPIAKLFALGASYFKGRADANARRARKDAEAYRNERERQDALDVGIGASDSERVKRLRDIADGRG